MRGAGRYFRLVRAFARFALMTEMSFRANFLVKVAVEMIWLFLMLIFYYSIFRYTNHIAHWGQAEFLCFLGCYYALAAVIETFFLENCNEFASLVRSGDLDFYLLQPIDEQFLITFRKIEWSSSASILFGVCVALFGLTRIPGWTFDVGWMGLFVLLFLCGVAMAYSFLLILMSTAVWLVRNQSLMELWWLFSTLMRYPREIFFVSRLASPMGWFFSFVVPVLLIVYVPAQTMLKAVEPRFVAFTLTATVLLLWLSRQFFRRALQSYRSASS